MTSELYEARCVGANAAKPRRAMTTDPNVERIQCDLKEKCAAVFAVRRANYTHRRKGVFNAQSIEDLTMCGNCATLSK
jgi:hypothetical protein